MASSAFIVTFCLLWMAEGHGLFLLTTHRCKEERHSMSIVPVWKVNRPFKLWGGSLRDAGRLQQIHIYKSWSREIGTGAPADHMLNGVLVLFSARFSHTYIQKSCISRGRPESCMWCAGLCIHGCKRLFNYGRRREIHTICLYEMHIWADPRQFNSSYVKNNGQVGLQDRLLVIYLINIHELG